MLFIGSIILGLAIGFAINSHVARIRKIDKIDEIVKNATDDLIYEYRLKHNPVQDVEDIIWKYADKENMIAVNEDKEKELLT